MSSASAGYADEFGMPLYLTTGAQFQTELFERVFTDALKVELEVYKELVFLLPPPVKRGN